MQTLVYYPDLSQFQASVTEHNAKGWVLASFQAVATSAHGYNSTVFYAAYDFKGDPQV